MNNGYIKNMIKEVIAVVMAKRKSVRLVHLRKLILFSSIWEALGTVLGTVVSFHANAKEPAWIPTFNILKFIKALCLIN